jgi:streptogramin lyase
LTGSGLFHGCRRRWNSCLPPLSLLCWAHETEAFGSALTLIRIQNQKVREAFPAPQMPLARKLAADPQSGIWLGLLNGDLARYRSGKTEIFPFTHHPGSRVNGLIAASDGSILGATAFGVVGWKNGKRQILTVRNGLPCDSIHALISDDRGNLWLYAQCGLIEIADAELRLRRYGASLFCPHITKRYGSKRYCGQPPLCSCGCSISIA